MSTANNEAVQTEETTSGVATDGTTRTIVGTNEGGQATNTHGLTRRQLRILSQNRKPAATAVVFKGETAKMNGHVFQVHSERKNKSQFMETLEALRIYSSTAYKDDIESLTVLFTKLEQPVVKEPEEPVN